MELPGGGPERTLADVRSAMSAASLASVSRPVRALFGLRRLLGRIFGWDAAAARKTPSLLDRISEQDRSRSLVPPGSSDGPFAVVYVHRQEALSEVRNATVHAFSVLALRPAPAGYRLFWAIHVAPEGRITAFYMALIDPFRRFVVYPAMLRQLNRSWRARFPGGDAGSGRPTGA